MPLPLAILFDLDDTLIRAYAQPEDAWTRLLHVFAAPLDAHDTAAIERVRMAVMDEARAFWSDRAAAAKWRLDIPGARRLSVRRGLARLGYHDEALADRIADAFTELRRAEYRLYPDALATVDTLRQRGVKLALVTNGAAEFQRAKIERFDLGHRFDHIQIEGEFGMGKPELDVYRHALERLGCAACDAWMVGDNYEWEVEAPQKLGLCGIWYDPFEAGIPAHATAQPTRVIRRLGELLE
ncbi:MAG: HAD family hydrolase [Reyranella sp.]|uniref:HAD family hydrolase n=1 Tax=Reyranella sp. TaxID=1929291 RepID=UPI001AD38202|nr:HAD family hydrolase [Reyranella sp.]MBN9091340.1 HAD family hydrolase [Reyranella sp.]